MKRWIPFLFILTASPTALTCNFLPENNLTIPIHLKNSGLTEKEYNEVIDKFVGTYEKILSQIGKTLTINRLWEDPRVNASTIRKGQEVIINLHGGFARHPEVTADGYALVLCHELGHHLGGSPKKNLRDSSWPSTEGQADYYATLKCLRKVFRIDANEEMIKGLVIPRVVKTHCSESFKRHWEVALCIRTTMAGIAVANVMANTSRETLPDINQPDTLMVENTIDNHPTNQCRLDTYFQGSICEISSSKPVSGKDDWTGVCHPKNGQTLGLRPACWYKQKGPE